MMLRVRESRRPIEGRNLPVCAKTNRGARSSFRNLLSGFRPDSRLEKRKEMTDPLLVARLVLSSNSSPSSLERNQRRSRQILEPQTARYMRVASYQSSSSSLRRGYRLSNRWALACKSRRVYQSHETHA